MFRIVVVLLLSIQPLGAEPLLTPMRSAIGTVAAEEDGIASFYRDRAHAPIWIGAAASERRAALLTALAAAPSHGLPDRGDHAALRRAFETATGASGLGRVEAMATRAFVRLVREASGGVLVPSVVDASIHTEPPVRDVARDLAAIAGPDPHAFLRSIWPDAPDYVRLLRAKLELEAARDAGGWGEPVPAGTLRLGDDGPAVIALRDRLAARGYLTASATARFDEPLEAAVRAFQRDHGLPPDGEAGAGTIDALNVPIGERLDQVLVGLERLRWSNRPRAPRHVLVNLAEQRAYVVDGGRVTFDTVVVVGEDTDRRRTPEFDDTMTHLVVNPTWHVPRSIAVREYLPQLRRGGARHLEVHGRQGQVDRGRIDFARYDASSFPYSLKQPPGPGNALGRVKFMIPNVWNIYLHDTPSRDLFARDVRTFSHGCVRVGRPLDLAYHLLAAQDPDARATFDGILAAGRERRIDLEEPIGVHIVYRSVWAASDGRVHWRGDPYGRDAAVSRALAEAGVAARIDGS